MPIQSMRGAVMPNPSPNGGAAIHRDAVAVVNALTYGLLWGGAGTLISVGTVRLDLQGYTGAGDMNLQLQVNGIGAPSTLATVLVAPTVQALPPPSPRRGPQETEIVRVIKSALFDSLHDFEQGLPHIWRVFGNPSS